MILLKLLNLSKKNIIFYVVGFDCFEFILLGFLNYVLH